MTDPSSNTGSETKAPILAWTLFPLALFPLIALLTYDWRAIGALQTPPLPHTNWIGALGDYFAYFGYMTFGLAIWIVPVLCVVAGICLVRGRRMRPARRELWLIVFLAAVSCLMQVVSAHGGLFAALARAVNIPNAGGAIGYLAMTRMLSPLISDFGSSVVVAMLIVFSLVAAVGLEVFAALFRALWNWARGGETRLAPVAAPSAETDPFAESPVPGATPAEDPFEAARRARAEVLRQKQEEKARARQEKEAEKERRRQEKENAKLAKWEAKHGITRDAPVAAPATAAAPVPAAAPAPTAAADNQTAEPEDKGPYILPSLDLLKPLRRMAADHSDVDEMSHRLIDTLKLFNIDATMSFTVLGPVVTKYAIRLAPGTRYAAVTSLSDNLMGALRAKSLRIEAPIPGKEEVGIEVPNRAPAGISFREVFESDAWRNSKAELPLLFGKRADGEDLVADLASMPHMLVAGATGQGKSVCLNSLICGLLMTRTPDQLKLIMVDPKCVEFTPYSSIPHLLVPVITENRKVVFSLHWAVAEMDKRLKLFARAHVKNIYDYNHRPNITQTDMFGNDAAVASDMPRTVPYIVIIIDEAADLIGQCGKEVNPDIQRITQKARAAGIHLILATQRPDAKIITGTIKANIPGRVAFKTATSVDSRTILDDSGAENLIGKGDMLFRGKDNVLVRAQGAWISDEEIASVTSFIEQHSNTAFDQRFEKKLATIKEQEIDIFADDSETGEEESKAAAAEAREQVKAEENASDFKKAVECIINTQRASTSHFQRKLGWGYNHSAKIMDMLEDAGIISPHVGAGPRQIVMGQDELLAIFNGTSTGGGAEAAETAETAPQDEGAADAPEQLDATTTTEEANV